jgi:hypothetical protein
VISTASGRVVEAVDQHLHEMAVTYLKHSFQ